MPLTKVVLPFLGREKPALAKSSVLKLRSRATLSASCSSFSLDVTHAVSVHHHVQTKMLRLNLSQLRKNSGPCLGHIMTTDSLMSGSLSTHSKHPAEFNYPPACNLSCKLLGHHNKNNTKATFNSKAAAAAAVEQQ